MADSDKFIVISSESEGEREQESAKKCIVISDSEDEGIRPEPFQISDSEDEEIRPEPFQISDSEDEGIRPEPFQISDSEDEEIRPKPFNISDSKDEGIRPEPFKSSDSEDEEIRPEPPKIILTEELKAKIEINHIKAKIIRVEKEKEKNLAYRQLVLKRARTAGLYRYISYFKTSTSQVNEKIKTISDLEEELQEANCKLKSLTLSSRLDSYCSQNEEDIQAIPAENKVRTDPKDNYIFLSDREKDPDHEIWTRLEKWRLETSKKRRLITEEDQNLIENPPKHLKTSYNPIKIDDQIPSTSWQQVPVLSNANKTEENVLDLPKGTNKQDEEQMTVVEEEMIVVEEKETVVEEQPRIDEKENIQMALSKITGDLLLFYMSENDEIPCLTKKLSSLTVGERNMKEIGIKKIYKTNIINLFLCETHANDFRHDNVEFAEVLIEGTVVSFEENSSKWIQLYVTDGTATIKCIADKTNEDFNQGNKIRQYIAKIKDEPKLSKKAFLYFGNLEPEKFLKINRKYKRLFANNATSIFADKLLFRHTVEATIRPKLGSRVSVHGRLLCKPGNKRLILLYHIRRHFTTRERIEEKHNLKV